ncbi:MAG: cyclopropane-fatty-acyl-phospholipid synthase [Solirubrobacteraceae bacterium]|jgi:cyclopropane-fatty-acyl-phospholipid synthase|nr:cyclopropane-fatty-acyl-phospholipid synthase [Solirubrobacteraceae bacterium]
MALGSSTAPLRRELEAALPERPFELHFWDGSALPATLGDGAAPVFSARSPRAVAHALRAPGQLGLSRAYVSGELEIDDLDAVLALLRDWSPPAIDGATQRRLLLAAVRAAGLQRPPRPPAVELRPRGKRHSLERDARAVRHHYDVSNEFFRLFLGESMTYSCAVFEDPSSDRESLEDAQWRKRELICTKLALKPGERVLDVGCGWGSFAVHAAAEHGARVVGITLSEPQARGARERAEAAGVGDRVEIRVADYRELRGEHFDAIASIGMVEHVGARNIDVYAAQLAGLLAPGGRLLNHGIARLRHGEGEAGGFSERYVFPDAAPLHLSRVQFALERAGFEVEHVEGFREHYARTLTHWLTRLDDNAEEAERLAGPERMRVWRLYLRGARNGFRTGFTSIYQVRCRRV